MPYETALVNPPPDTVAVGEPFTFAVETCCTDSGGCTDRRIKATVGGEPVMDVGAAFSSDFCVEFPVDDYGISPADPISVNGSDVVISEPGTYTISWPDGSREITVEEGVTADNVSIGFCAVNAGEHGVGDSVPVAGDVVNNNSSTATVTVEMAVVPPTQSSTPTVTAYDTATATQTFTIPANTEQSFTFEIVPDTAGDYGVSVGVANVEPV